MVFDVEAESGTIVANSTSTPFSICRNFSIATIFTSMFMHGGFMHLIGNMLYMWIFADNIEDNLGPFKFLVFYLLAGIGAAMTQVLMDVQSQVPMIGASGAIAGTLGAYIVLYPKAKIFVFAWIVIFVKLLKIPAFIVIRVWIGLQVMNVFDQGVSGVAYSAHIGGFICGVLLTPFFKKKETKIFAQKVEKSYISENVNNLNNDNSLKHIPKFGKNKKSGPLMF